MQINLYKHATKSLTLLLLLAVTLLSACNHSDEPIPAPDPDDGSGVSVRRTILVYMVANNNLSGFDTDDISEMQQAAAAGDIGANRLIVYHQTSNKVVLKEILKDRVDTLKVYDPDVLSVSIQRMTEVLDDMGRLAPAESYGLILWSHASGWLQDGISEPELDKRRSFGSDGYSKGKKMNITSLAAALKDRDLDFIYFDCCYMGSLEVMYELRHCTPYIVCSPAEVPAEGMPYNLTLKHLFDTEGELKDKLLTAASTTFNFYNDVYVKGECPSTETLIDTSGLDRLAEATKSLYSNASIINDPNVDYQKYQKGTCYYFDFFDYIESIAASQADIDNVKKAAESVILYKSATPWLWSSFEIKRCCGLSTYIMESVSDYDTKNYDTLSWYKDVAYALIK